MRKTPQALRKGEESRETARSGMDRDEKDSSSAKYTVIDQEDMYSKVFSPGEDFLVSFVLVSKLPNMFTKIMSRLSYVEKITSECL